MEKLSRKRLATAFVRLVGEVPLPQLMRSLAAEVIRNHLTQHIDALVSDIGQQLLLQRRQLHASVSSARPLAQGTVTIIKKTLQQMTNAHSVQLDLAVDPSLVGGVVIRTPGSEINASLMATLKQLSL